MERADERAERDAGQPGAEGERRDDRVGLGRVVEDQRSSGRPRTHDAGGPGIEESSEESFPASDPPTYMSGPATPGGPEQRPDSGREEPPAEAPDPHDVP